jgi:hypothetical protein
MKQKKPGTPWADSFNKEEAQSLPDLSLEKVTRNSVYKSILAEGRKEREKDGLPEDEAKSESVADGTKGADFSNKEVPVAVKSKKPAMAKYSPLDPEILDLMYGKDEELPDNEQKPESKAGEVKKTQFMKK